MKYGNDEPLTAEHLIQASIYGDMVSLIILYLFRRIDQEGFQRFLKVIDEKKVAEK